MAIRIALLGSARSGKSALLHKSNYTLYLDSYFDNTVCIKTSKGRILFNLTEIGGHHYLGCDFTNFDCAVVFYNADSKLSYNIGTVWQTKFQEQSKAPAILCSNKTNYIDIFENILRIIKN